MKRIWITGLVVLMAGCASSPQYAPMGISSDQRSPDYGNHDRAYSADRYVDQAGSYDVDSTKDRRTAAASQTNSRRFTPQPEQPGVIPWLKSGRGITWGSASNGPVRDPGLDRIMVDTLGSSTPGFSRSPVGRPAASTTSETWVYPR